MRLFIAINFTDDALDELEINVDDLKDESEKGSFTERENFHITLAFLDEVENRDIPLIQECMVRAVMNFDTEPLNLTLGGLGSFKRKGKTDRIYYREVISCTSKEVKSIRNGIKKTVETDRLSQLADNIRRELDYSGIYYDDKPFKPHVTLARGCRTFYDFDEEWFEEGLEEVSMTVKDICLMESIRQGKRVIYRPVYVLKV